MFLYIAREWCIICCLIIVVCQARFRPFLTCTLAVWGWRSSCRWRPENAKEARSRSTLHWQSWECLKNLSMPFYAYLVELWLSGIWTLPSEQFLQALFEQVAKLGEIYLFYDRAHAQINKRWCRWYEASFIFFYRATHPLDSYFMLTSDSEATLYCLGSSSLQ